MKLKATSLLTLQADSLAAGQAAGATIAASFQDDPLRLLLVYGSINHDQAALLEGLREAAGPDVRVVGCSAQGIVANGELTEEGFALGVMGLGGSELGGATAIAHQIDQAPRDCGRALGQELKAELGRQPALVGLLYDASCGADVEQMLAGMRFELSCPVIGAGASHLWGPPVTTYQYFGAEAFDRSAVAFGLTGPFETELAVCHGTSPTGVAMTVTRSEGNRLLELDGRPALDVFREAVGLEPGQLVHQDHLGSSAIAIERMVRVSGPEGVRVEPAYLIRAATGFDHQTGAVVVQAGIPSGTRVFFHHRTVSAVLDGTRVMGQELALRLRGKTPWAVLGFECCARTAPFLGMKATIRENAELREQVGCDVPWLGMMAWGEIAPSGGEPAFHNYTYPLAVLVERAESRGSAA
jgi:hypothetical protein